MIMVLLVLLMGAGFVQAGGGNLPTAPTQGPPAPSVRNSAPPGAIPAGEKGLLPAVESTYPIGPGDLLGISVWKDEALTKDVVVLPDGTISFPLLGLLKAAGKTVAQLKAEVEEKIAQYVSDPVLNIEVKQVNSLIVYVIGRVNIAGGGKYPLNANVNVLQALAMAGGLNPFAKRDKIRIFRQEGGTTKTFPFHYDDVAEGRRLQENIELKRGDVIVVP
ncbi:MAG: polysaccharide biosynthesis/export family protein [Syntrophorhabdales bacterium]